MVRTGAQLLLTLSLLITPPRAKAGELRVYFFDVGQGDAALIIAPSGKTVLIDAGPPETAPALRAGLLQLLGGPIDLAILTHAHLDHFGGMAEALGARGAKLFMNSGFDHPSPSYEALLKDVDAHQIPRVNASPNHSFDLGGGARLEVLGPSTPFITGSRSDAGANSIVLRLVFGTRSILFAGDAEPETEAALLARKIDLRADVLKVAHHGARASSGAAFLSAVHPSIAVISAGPGNAIESPSRAVIDRLLATNAKVLRTDLDGEIRIVSDGKSLQVQSGHRADSPDARADVAQVEKHEHPRAREHAREKAPAAVAVERISDEPSLAQVHANAVATPTRGEARYVASQRSEVFHLANCRNAKRIKKENRVTFAKRQEAIDSGRRPASCCKP
jgi:competence protein ComEC